MYFEDGPLNYVNANFGSGNDLENLFSSPSGIPSVSTTNRPFPTANVIANIKSLHGQFKCILASMGVVMADSSARPIVKSAEEASKLRLAGNDKYASDQLDSCLKLYSQSVATAPDGSLELVLAFGNRSAVLYRLKEYEECLHDVNRALESTICPELTRRNLEERRERCLARIVDGGHSTTDGTDPITHLENDDDDPEWRALCQFKNPLIPNASAKFKIMCDDRWGRHLVATEDIAPGEILSVQKFNALVLHEDKHKARTHCAHCLSKCLALIPCPTCTKVMYCSKNCRARAYESYHRCECQVMYKANRPYKFRALRMLIEGTEQLTKIPELMTQMSVNNIMREKTDPSGQPFVNDYMAVLRMSRTFNDTLSSNFLTFVSDFNNALRENGLCGRGTARQRDALKITKKELFAMTLLLNHATTARSHTFSINPSVHDFDCLHDGVVGMGICALHSFVNHSCNPNVMFFTRNRQHVMMALRPIKKDEQLFHSYWKSFEYGPPKEDRIKVLSMFFGFTCKCEACTNNWPTVDVLKIRRPIFQWRDERAAKREMFELLRSLTNSEGIMLLRNEEIIRLLSQVCEWIHNNVKNPSYVRLACETVLAQFMTLTYDYLATELPAEGIKMSVLLMFDMFVRPHLFGPR